MIWGRWARVSVTAIEAWAENDGAEELPDLIDEALSALEGIQT